MADFSINLMDDSPSSSSTANTTSNTPPAVSLTPPLPLPLHAFRTPPTSPRTPITGGGSKTPRTPIASPRTPIASSPRTSAPSTPTFLVASGDQDGTNYLMKPQASPPLIQRTFARRLQMKESEEDRESIEDNNSPQTPQQHSLASLSSTSPSISSSNNMQYQQQQHDQLLSTNEDIFVIPPQLSIDEKLFQDEVILWSHYVKISSALKQPQSIFNFIFFSVFFITTIILAVCAHKYISMRAAIVTIWLMSPIILFSGFLIAKLLLEVLQCNLLGTRLTSKSLAYHSITDVRLATSKLSLCSGHNYPFIVFIGLDNVNAVNKILQQQRNSSVQAYPLDSPQELDIQNIPEKFGEFIQQADLPFLEVNIPPSFTSQYIRGTIKFVAVYLWVGVLLFLTHASKGLVFTYFASVLLLPAVFLLGNTLDKVDVLGAHSLVFLRVGLAYIKQCHYGRNVLRLGYESAYPLVSSYNIKSNKGDISFYNYTFANVASEDVIATEEMIFHKYLEAVAANP